MSKQKNHFAMELANAVVMAAAGGAAIYFSTSAGSMNLPSIGTVAGFFLFTLLTLTMAFPAPRIGFASLDRVSQVAMILMFGPLTAAIVSALAYLVWPFLSLYRKDFSPDSACIRSLHNAGMMTLVVLAGGFVYTSLGGAVPLMQLDGPAIGRVTAMAVAMQIVNDLFMGVLAWLRGNGFRHALSRFVDLIELAMLPVGVFTAIVYNVLPLGVFLLLILALLLLALLMRTFALNRADLEQRVRRMAAINQLAQAANASIQLDALAELTYTQCRKLLEFSSFHLVLYDEKANELDFVLHRSRGKLMPRRRSPAGVGLLGWVINNNQSALIINWEKDRSELKNRLVIIGEPPAAWLGVPVTYRGRVLGAMCVQNFVPDTFDKSDLDLMATFAGQVGAAIANAQLFGELEEYKRDLEHKVAARTQSLREANEVKEGLLAELQRKTKALDRLSKEDSLTGLYNRRFMDERLATELQRAERFGHDVAIAMADIDNFKHINDTCSHSVGDEVLRITAGILRRACRSIDIISRYGGEEFVLCFPETDIVSARNVCERIRGMMSAYDWEFVHPGLEVTISIGVAGGACYEQESLQKLADKKLYEAKDLGRDRVCA
ncbi:MAG TPA: diguanylate cyclase [Gammaproteobacteria bacterium]|nr:diguanylate cyclase [Gammaproteobacteria bacterium]